MTTRPRCGPTHDQATLDIAAPPQAHPDEQTNGDQPAVHRAAAPGDEAARCDPTRVLLDHGRPDRPNPDRPAT
jgi:hypothetical protein